VAHLTDKEKELIGLLLRGLTLEEMAKEKNVKKNTIESYFSQIRIKTNSPTNRAIVLKFKEI
jgi:DNA-binding CsgD family transcriptional regulator